MANKTSVYDVSRAQLAEWGISELADDIADLSKQGLGDAEFLLALRQTDSYKQRFAGNAIRLSKNMEVLSEKDYLSAEERYRDILSDPNYGLPTGFYDSPDDYAKMIGTNMGSGEIKGRLEAIKTVIYDGALNGTMQYAQEQYGLSTGDLIAVWLDPDRADAAIAQRTARASAIGAAAGRTGFGVIGTATAERLDALGLSADQAAGGFSEAASLRELTTSLDGDEAVTSDDLIKDRLEGNVDARNKVRRTQEGRLARFQGGGTYAESREGIAGLGDANKR